MSTRITSSSKRVIAVLPPKLLFWSLILARFVQGYMIDGDPNRRGAYLDSDEKYNLKWHVNLRTNRITFNVTVRTEGWILFGLANNDQQSTGKDVIIGGVSGGTPYFSDRHEEGNGGQLAIVDKSQDYRLEQAWEGRGETFLSFSRSLTSCDPEDYPITENKVSVIWAYGESDNYDATRRSYRQQRGSYELYLLDPEYAPRIVRDSAGNPTLIGNNSTADGRLQLWTISIQTRMPPEHTSYLCTIHKAPRLRRKHHVIGFDVHLPNAQSLEHVHHFTVYRCNAPPGYRERNLFERFVDTPGESCFASTAVPSQSQAIPRQFCSQLHAGWALGGRAFFFPPQAGLPLGEDADEYYLVQTHYDNPQEKVNVDVSVQMDFWYTSRLRPNDAGFMVGGIEIPSLPPTIVIPPQSTDHRVLGHCSSECTKRIFPPEGITVFSGLLHGHNSAVRMRLRHFDMKNKVELPWVTHDDNYSNRFQQIRNLRNEIKFLPGDQLTVECSYDNTWTNSSVIGGLSTTQEMCSSFVYYYGRIRDYSQCRSQIVSVEARRRFLGGLENITYVDEQVDWVATSPRRLAGLTVTEIANRVPWSRARREELQRYHEVAASVGSCARDLFTRSRESFLTALEARGQVPNANPLTNVNTEDDFSGLVRYPFEAKPYVPPKIGCPLQRFS